MLSQDRTNITFIIPTKNRPEKLFQCLASIKALREKETNFEIRVIVINNDTKDLKLNDHFDCLPITCYSLNNVSPAKARNYAVTQSEADYYYFIDDDTILPGCFIDNLREIIQKHPDVDIFGGPDQAPNNGILSDAALALSLQSPLTTLKTNQRHIRKDYPNVHMGNERNLILCNLCVHRRVFKEFDIWFDERFWRNEENVFLIQAANSCKILFFSNHYILHQRRSNLKGVISAAAGSGFYRAKMIKMLSLIERGPFLIPAVFVVYLLSMPLVINFTWWYIIPLISYISLNVATTLWLCRLQKMRLAPMVAFFQVIIVVSYGVGILWGLLKFEYCDTSLKNHSEKSL